MMEKYIGKILNDRYMITEVVGVGGMAYVYKAFDKICNRVVAVKILKDEFMSDAQFRRRFTNESKAITMLSHSNIVDVFDVSLEGDSLYLVMEYIDGITLKEYMEKKGVLSSVEALHFVKQVLKGLAHAHDRGIVHRDVKPHNIILLKDGTIKITDFGIARLTKFDTQTISDMAIGSVHYISPEQASGDRTDARSDIYSVGIILYEMLTGKLPFEADTAVAVALKQVQAQPELPTEVNPDLSQGLEDIILKAIMKDPDIRYQSGGAFLADIALYEEDPTITFSYSAAPVYENPIPESTDNSPTIFAEKVIPGRLIDDEENELEPDEDEEGEGESNDEEPSNFKTTWLPIICGIGTAFLLMIIAGLCFIFQKEWFGDDKVLCPTVVGQNIEEAKTAHNFNFVISAQIENDQAAGVIISQDPAANTKVEKNSTITVVVSSGPANKTPDSTNQNPTDESGDNYVPDVVGLLKAEALQRFKEQNIMYSFVTKNDKEVEKGRVISTYPAPGVEINSKEDIVTVYISDGPAEEEPPEVETVTMPDLTGLTLDVVKTTLKNNRLTLGKVTEEHHDEIEKGLVCSQSVLKETEVEEETAIDIVISLGPVEEVPPEDPTPENPNPGDEVPDDGNEEDNTPTDPDQNDKPVDKPSEGEGGEEQKPNPDNGENSDTKPENGGDTEPAV